MGAQAKKNELQQGPYLRPKNICVHQNPPSRLYSCWVTPCPHPARPYGTVDGDTPPAPAWASSSDAWARRLERYTGRPLVNGMGFVGYRRRNQNYLLAIGGRGRRSMTVPPLDPPCHRILHLSRSRGRRRGKKDAPPPDPSLTRGERKGKKEERARPRRAPPLDPPSHRILPRAAPLRVCARVAIAL
jgi:hypothetical protein